ncbi:MAG: hypothetical protein KI790_02675 [Cyclobacteriaceae bacterium]|nr:hypothetical protein [Cyclobacteriaceae bacterium HetDA_MAG_MS6]
MKKSTFPSLAIMLLLLSFSTQATVFTLSTDPQRPAQYSVLQEAYDAAAIGDTILIYGSTTAYGNLNIEKPIVIIGEGYHNNGGLRATVGSLTLSRANGSLGADDVTLMGLVTSTITLNPYAGTSTDDVNNQLNNITINRCNVGRLSVNNFYAVSTLNNINIINCFSNDDILISYNRPNQTIDITYYNSILDSFRVNASLTRNAGNTLQTFNDLSGVRFLNNIFINDVANGLLSNAVGVVFEENIFYGHELYNTDYEQITWNHNLFYLTTEDDTPGLFSNNNTGTGNVLNQDPLFVDFPTSGAAFSFAYDFHLQAGSPALTAGITGDEIGIYGGTYPYEVGANPPIPTVTELTILDGTSSVPVGGTININFKAKAGN